MYVGMGSAATPLPAALYPVGVPISCPSDEQVTPIKAWVNSPNDPEYLAASNWQCIKKSVMAEHAGFTFAAGLKSWANPVVAVATAVSIVPYAKDSPAYAAGLWVPILAVGAFFWSRGGKR